MNFFLEYKFQRWNGEKSIHHMKVRLQNKIDLIHTI